MDVSDRIQKYLDSCPPAISGSGGHSQTFFVACRLANGFALSESDVLAWLNVYNKKCDPPWSQRELAHKAKQAMKGNHGEPRGHLLGSGRFNKSDTVSPKVKETPAPEVKFNPVEEMREFLNGAEVAEEDLFEASPVRLDDWTNDGWRLLENLFQPDEFINFVTSWEPYQKKGGKEIKANPKGIGKFLRCEELVEDWRTNGMPASEAGGWLRINPVDGGGVHDKNITAFRYALVEFDAVPVAMQIAFLAKVPLPIACILTSGGKSVHAWIKVDATDFKDYEATVEKMRNLLTRFGIDRVNKNPSRLSRLVGVTRKIGATGDGRQRLLYLNPNPMQRAIIGDDIIP